MMTEDILNAVLTALSQRLHSVFPEVSIFSEIVPQSLPDKCFFVDFAGNVNIKKELGRRYCCSGKLDISFYIDRMSESARAEYNRVYSAIAAEMKYISADGMKIRLDNYVRNITDDILHVLCDFNIKYAEVDNTEMIGKVEQRYETK